MVEFWLGTFPVPGRIAEIATMAEDDGWDGLAFTDSQNLGGDVFAALAIAARCTTKITLATGATNPATRHPAVIASAIATVHVESKGRAWLGIARGDSALAQFGLALEQIHAYLRAGSVDCDGFASQIQWLAGRQLRPPHMSVDATGPKVIRLAARLADGITFSVGADIVRLRTAIDLARRTRTAAGLPPLRLGAYINAVAHPDVGVARDLVRGRLGVYARFSTMDPSVLSALSEADRKVADELVNTYDMQSHAASGGRHEAALGDDFVDRFGIVGPSEHVAERLTELVSLGLDHVVIVGHSRNTPPEVFSQSSRRFCEEVMPAVRRPA